MRGDPLAPEVRRLFGNLAHAGRFGEEPTGEMLLVHGEAGRQQRGTHVRFSLRVDRGCIIAVRFQAYGCPYTLATCEWLSRELEAGSSRTTPADWCRTLGIPIVRLGRLLVVEDALHAALLHDSIPVCRRLRT